MGFNSVCNHYERKTKLDERGALLQIYYKKIQFPKNKHCRCFSFNELLLLNILHFVLATLSQTEIGRCLLNVPLCFSSVKDACLISVSVSDIRHHMRLVLGRAED